MDYPTWPYFYDNGVQQVRYYFAQGHEQPFSGDDIARLKAGHRA